MLRVPSACRFGSSLPSSNPINLPAACNVNACHVMIQQLYLAPEFWSRLASPIATNLFSGVDAHLPPCHLMLECYYLLDSLCSRLSLHIYLSFLHAPQGYIWKTLFLHPTFFWSILYLNLRAQLAPTEFSIRKGNCAHALRQLLSSCKYVMSHEQAPNNGRTRDANQVHCTEVISEQGTVIWWNKTNTTV